MQHQAGDIVQDGYVVITVNKWEAEELGNMVEKHTYFHFPGEKVPNDDEPIISEIPFKDRAPRDDKESVVSLLKICALLLKDSEHGTIFEIFDSLFQAGIDYERQRILSKTLGINA